MGEQTLLQILPEAGVGVAAIIAIVMLTKEFLKMLRVKDETLAKELREREDSFRSFVRERHAEFVDMHKATTTQLSENTRVMSEVISHLRK